MATTSIYRLVTDSRHIGVFVRDSLGELVLIPARLSHNRFPCADVLASYEIRTMRAGMKYADVVGDSLGFYFVNERTRLLFQTQFPSEVDCSFQQRIKARNYFCLNPKIVCDCVDLLKSDIFSRHSDDDMDFGLHVRFRRDYVPDCYLFKAQQDASKIFATEKFVGFAREHRLTGIFFEDAEKMMGLRGAHNAVHGFPMA